LIYQLLQHFELILYPINMKQTRKLKTRFFNSGKGLLCLLLPFVPMLSTAQQSTDNPTKLDINIKTPNAASIERYGNIPVSMYTGVPNINIPLHVISVGKHALPIAASYHASGIKVNDLSGDIGLGWNLSAEYSISRVLRGNPDDHPNGYRSSVGGPDKIPSNYSLSTSVTVDTFKKIAKGLWDTQPDEYNFTIGTASGKFIVGTDRIVVIPDQDIKVEYTDAGINNVTFVITDSKGVRYVFNEKVLTEQVDCEGNSNTYISSWKVSQVTFPDTKDVVQFQYTDEPQSVSDVSQTRSYHYDNEQSFAPPGGFEHYKECINYTNTLEKKLSAIVYPYGKVQFTYNFQKQDISGSTALGYFEVLDGQNAVLKKVGFNYQYYTMVGGNSTRKLKLNGIDILLSGSPVQQYLFDYNTAALPVANVSKAQDIWGYYNGADNNTSLIPGNTYELHDAQNMPFMVPGGDRTVNPLATQNGILTKITYPTGGTTTFEYENNKAGYECSTGAAISDNVVIKNNVVVSSQCQGNISPYQQSNFTDFTVPYDQSTVIVAEGNTNNCTGDTRQYTLTDLTTNQVISQDDNNDPEVALIGGHTYRLSVVTNCENAEANMLDCQEKLKATLTYTSLSGTVNKYRYAGGLRVKKITDYDLFSNQNTIRNYNYTMPGEADRSSGIQMFVPVFASDYKYDVPFNPVQNGGASYMSQVALVSAYTFSSSVNNTTQSSGNSVGYKYVTESIGAQGEGGYTVYNYTTPYASCALNYPYVPQTDYSHKNGKVLTAQAYSNAGTLLQQTNNYYSYALNDQVRGWKAVYEKVGDVTWGPSTGSPLNFTESKLWGQQYHYKSEKEHLDSTVVTQYYDGNTIAQKQTFQYGTNSYYPYQVTTSGSTSETVTQTTRRATDFAISASGTLTGVTQALKYMKDNHLNDYVIESYSQVNGNTVGAYINEYGLYTVAGKELAMPVNLYRLKNGSSMSNYTPLSLSISSNTATLAKDSRYEQEAAYSNFNAGGNPGRLVDKSGESSLLWGYDGRYMVARLDHIDYNALQTYLSNNPSVQQTLDNPATAAALLTAIQQLRTAFPDALISGYTYVPGIGISSVSDANNQVSTYEYDNLGRLLRIKDANGNLIKTYDYQYQN